MTKGNEYVMHRFDNIGEFVKASKRLAVKHESSHKDGDRHGYGENWAGTKTFQEAVDFAEKGGWEPTDMLEFRHMFDNIEPRLRKFVETQFERGMDQAGFEVNMQAYLDGEPDHMFQWVPAEHMVTKRALCILIGHSVSAGCTSKELFIRGQAAIALVRALMLLGYELEIWSEETVSGYRTSKKYSTLVRLHAAGSVLDESAVEFAVGNPAWLRRLLFGHQEGQPQQIRSDYGFGEGGYGSPAGVHHADLVGADVQLDLGRTWFSEGRRAADQVAEDGMKWVVQQLKDLGVVDANAEWED